MKKSTPTANIIPFPRRKKLTAEELAEAVFTAVPLARFYEAFVKGYCHAIVTKSKRK